MKMRLILLVSLVLNGALFGAFVLTKQSAVERPAEEVRVPEGKAAGKMEKHADREVRVLHVPTPGGFDWANVESEDFREYIANLRAIGCPEETIRDIIIADINKLFAARAAALYPSPADYKFWQTNTRESRDTERARERQLRELEREKAALVKELLGVDLEREMARWTGRPDGDEYRYGFLSAEKQEQVQALRDKYRDLERAIMSEGGFTPENRAKLMALRAQREAEMAQMLTPAEFEEYQLRNSWTARNMREGLGSFEPTQAEFTEIFKLRKAFDDQYGFLRDGGDETLRQQRQLAQQQLDEQLRAILGDQRFREYQLAQDDRFRDIYEFTQRNNLPKQTAEAIYDVRQAVDAERRKLEADRSLPPAERQALLAAISQETQNALMQTLGENYNDFRRRNSWVDRMVRVESSDRGRTPEGVRPPDRSRDFRGGDRGRR